MKIRIFTIIASLTGLTFSSYLTSAAAPVRQHTVVVSPIFEPGNGLLDLIKSYNQSLEEAEKNKIANKPKSEAKFRQALDLLVQIKNRVDSTAANNKGVQSFLIMNGFMSPTETTTRSTIEDNIFDVISKKGFSIANQINSLNPTPVAPPIIPGADIPGDLKVQVFTILSNKIDEITTKKIPKEFPMIVKEWDEAANIFRKVLAEEIKKLNPDKDKLKLILGVVKLFENPYNLASFNVQEATKIAKRLSMKP